MTQSAQVAEPSPGGTKWWPDLLAGCTAAAIVIPKAMAYATVAGLPVEVGLYTAFIPMVVYAVLGTSRVLSVSSTTTIAILAGTQLAVAAPDGDSARLVTATATLSVLVGAILLLARVLRLGMAANFISAPVLTGFKAGIGLVIVLDQVPKLLGLHIEKSAFFPDLLAVVRELPHALPISSAIGLLTLALLFFLERIRPHSAAPVLVVAAAIAVAWWFGLADRGVSVVGHIPQGFPQLTLPSLELVQTLAPGALGIALMSFTESIAAGRAFVTRDDPLINPNRELVALGAANVAGSFLGAMPAGGGTSQTAVVRSTGALTQRASLVTAAIALATMLLLAPVLAQLPNATLAAVVIVYSVGLIQPREFLDIRRIRMREFRWAIVACAGVLLLGTMQGIVVAIVVSLVSLFSQSANPVVYVIGRMRGADVLRPLSPDHPDDETFEGLLIVRPVGRIFFANAQNVADQIAALVRAHRPKVLAIDLSRVHDIEYSALQVIIEGERRAREHGEVRWLAGLNPEVLEVVRRSGLADRLGRDRLLFNARAVIERYQAMEA